MKKVTQMLSFLLLLFVLAGCTETKQPTTEGMADETESVEEEQPEEEVEKEKEPVVVTEPDPEPESSQAEKDAYTNKVSTTLERTAQSLTDFGALNQQAAQNPNLMFDNDWQNDMALALVGIQMGADDLREMDVPPEMSGIHNTMMEGMKEFEYVVDNYPNALENMDVNMIDQCTIAMENGGEYMEEATNMLMTYIEEESGQ